MIIFLLSISIISITPISCSMSNVHGKFIRNLVLGGSKSLVLNSFQCLQGLDPKMTYSKVANLNFKCKKLIPLVEHCESLF